MGALHAAQIIGDLGFEHGIDGLAKIMAQQHVFGRNGAVGFQLEHPVPVGLPEVEQGSRRGVNAPLESGGIVWASFGTIRIHYARCLSVLGLQSRSRP